MDAQTRFAKIFKLISENENKIGVGMQCRDLKTYIKAERLELKDKTSSIKRALPKMSKSSDLDITALYAIVKCGEILEDAEKASTGLVENTVGDLVERLRHLRNDIVHSGEASLEFDEYNRHLDELRYIAKYFERVNGVAQDTYKNKIDHIDRQKWADKEVQDEIKLFKTYLKNVLQSAIVQHGLFSSSHGSTSSNKKGYEELEMENTVLKSEIEELTAQHNVAAEDRSEVLYPIRRENTTPHPDCYYCRQAHAPDNQAGCNVM